MYCWGKNGFGQLGTGDGLSHTTPQPAGSFSNCLAGGIFILTRGDADDEAREVLRQILGTEAAPSVVILSEGASPIVS